MTKTVKLNKDIKQFAIRILSDDHRHMQYLNISSGYARYSQNPVIYNSSKTAESTAKSYLKSGEYEIVEFILRLEEVKKKQEDFLAEFVRTRQRYQDVEEQSKFDEIFQKSKQLTPINSASTFHTYTETYEIEGKIYDLVWDYHCGANAKPISISMKL